MALVSLPLCSALPGQQATNHRSHRWDKLAEVPSSKVSIGVVFSGIVVGGREGGMGKESVRLTKLQGYAKEGHVS